MDKLVRQLKGERLVLTLFPVAFLAHVTMLLSRTNSVIATKMCLYSTFLQEAQRPKKILCTSVWLQNVSLEAAKNAN